MKKIKTELIGSIELNKAKQHLIGGLNLGLESSDSIAMY
jgi:hypothetical protein